MKDILVKFKDEEFGDKLVKLSYDNERYDYKITMNLAMEILYISFSDYSYNGSCPEYEELKEDYPELTKELYDVCMYVLDEGNYGVTTERFCDFMNLAFGWKYEIIQADSVFDVENGRWSYE